MADSNPDSRTRILDAAEQLFAEKGFDKATIKEIGANAGQNAALLYYYFDSKETLYRQVLARAISQLSDGAAKKIAGAADPDAVIRGTVAGQAELMARHPFLPRIFARELLDWSATRADSAAHQLYGQLFTRLRDAIRAGQETGHYRRTLDPAFTAVSIISQVAYLVLARPLAAILLERGPDGITNADIESFANHAVRFALAALHESTPTSETPQNSAADDVRISA